MPASPVPSRRARLWCRLAPLVLAALAVSLLPLAPLNAAPPRAARCSPASTVASEIVFVNKTARAISTYWYNFGCDEIFYQTVQPSSSYTQQTWVGHIWVVRDTASGKVLRDGIVATPGQITVTIADPKVTIKRVDDRMDNLAYPPGHNAEGTVEGNQATAHITIDNTPNQGEGVAPISGKVTLKRKKDAKVLGEPLTVLVDPGGTLAVKIKFFADGMAWDDKGMRTPQQEVVAEFEANDKTVFKSEPIQFAVRPRPVILVHGLVDTTSSWSTYKGFLASIGIEEAFAVDTLNTGGVKAFGFLDWTTDTMAMNTARLDSFVGFWQRQSRAEQVDIVAHSMGGLFARSYIANGMDVRDGRPAVRQLIMLGTPNRGASAASLIVLALSPGAITYAYPSTLELTGLHMFFFNQRTTARKGVKFYAVAGNYGCLRPPWPVLNFLEELPNDVVVARSSVFGIPLDGRWTYPAGFPGCEGHHSYMRSSGPLDGGKPIFDLFVSPLLRGIKPSAPSEPAATTQSQAAELEAAKGPVQFTPAITGTLRPGVRLELPLAAELGSPVTFNVVAPPAQVRVSLREPGGATSTPGALAPGVTYGVFADGTFPITQYTVDTPVAGAYTVIVEATAATPVAGVPVAVSASFESAISLEVLGDGSPPIVKRPALIGARLQRAGQALGGASVVALLVAPDGGRQQITLRDDGTAGDATPGDGIYGASFTPARPGVYHAVVTAEATLEGKAIGRAGVWAATVEGESVALPLISR